METVVSENDRSNGLAATQRPRLPRRNSQKKLGFTLTSKKLEGKLRRYRIETKRDR